MSEHPLHLTDTDVGFFTEQGYLVYHHQLFPAAKFRRLQRFFDAMLEQLPADARPEGKDVPHFAFPELFEWLAAEEVLDFVERLIGPNIALWASHFLCKPAAARPGGAMARGFRLLECVVGASTRWSRCGWPSTTRCPTTAACG